MNSQTMERTVTNDELRKEFRSCLGRAGTREGMAMVIKSVPNGYGYRVVNVEAVIDGYIAGEAVLTIKAEKGA